MNTAARVKGEAALIVVTAAAVVGLLVSTPEMTIANTLYDPSLIGVLLCPVVLVLAAVSLLREERLAHAVTVFGAAMPLPWLFLTELRQFRLMNSWIVMNWNSEYLGGLSYIRYSQFRILSVALLLVALTWALTSLLPTNWNVRNRPVNARLWPAVAMSILIVSIWFVAAVTPYREPAIEDGSYPEISILHVVKHGSTFDETRISVYRDCHYMVVNDHRNLFHYRFPQTVTEGTAHLLIQNRIILLGQDPQPQRSPKQRIPPLRAWKAEGWYAMFGRRSMEAFTTENQTSPPPELVSLFNEVASYDPRSRSQWEVADVCLGFCYDPLAAMGVRFANQRCSYSKDECY